MSAPLSPEDFAAITRLVCAHCRHGNAAVQRSDTGEWVHNHATAGTRRSISHTICWADELRRSAYNPELTGGSDNG